MALRWLEVSLALTFGSGAASYGVMRLPRLPRRIVFAVLLLAVLCSPLIVPSHARILRFASVLATVSIAVRLYDSLKSADAGYVPGLWDYFSSLIHPFALVLRRAIRQKRPERRADLRQMLVCFPLGIGAVALIFTVFCLPWRHLPFVAEHTAKAISVFLMIQFLPNALAAAFRLVDIPATNFAGPFFLARTPAEFWRLYNRPVNQFFHEYIFKPARGRQHPLAVTFLIFLISGIIHEYVFDIVAPRVIGWQMLFFTLQGLAATATVRLRPHRGIAIPAMVLTFLFNLATVYIFLKCLNAVLPFYVDRTRP